MIDLNKDTWICAFCGKIIEDYTELATWCVKNRGEFPMHNDCCINGFIDNISDEEAIRFKSIEKIGG